MPPLRCEAGELSIGEPGAVFTVSPVASIQSPHSILGVHRIMKRPGIVETPEDFG